MPQRRKKFPHAPFFSHFDINRSLGNSLQCRGCLQTYENRLFYRIILFYSGFGSAGLIRGFITPTEAVGINRNDAASRFSYDRGAVAYVQAFGPKVIAPCFSTVINSRSPEPCW